MDFGFKKEAEFIKKFIPSWKNLTDDEIIFEKQKFGFLRPIFKVSNLKGIDPQAIIMRKFNIPQNKSEVENQIQEKLTFKLFSEVKLGPKIIAEDDFLRIEEYIDSRNIKAKEINDRKIRRKLAIILGRIHSSQTKFLDPNSNFILKWLNNQEEWKKIEKNLGDESLIPRSDEKFISGVRLIMQNDLELIKRIAKRFKMVLSHNDIWCGNILLTEDKKVYFIDYERVDFNFAGFDLGKLLLESMFDREERPPFYKLKPENFVNDSDLKDFVQFYLFSRLGIDKYSLFQAVDSNEVLDNIFELNLISNQEVEEMLFEVNIGFAFSGFFMCMIGLTIGNSLGCGKEFITLAKDGFEIYKKYSKYLKSDQF